MHLPAELIRKAKVYAAEQDTSLNGLIKELLEQTVESRNRMRAAGARILEIAQSGPHSNVDPESFTRSELYERW